jgi:hypothetical protein
MRKNKKHLNFYKRCMKTGYLPEVGVGGLCSCATRKLISVRNLEKFEPTSNDYTDLEYEGFAVGFWAYGRRCSHSEFSRDAQYQFTPLRQTIVLFMAALNNEL